MKYFQHPLYKKGVNLFKEGAEQVEITSVDDSDVIKCSTVKLCKSLKLFKTHFSTAFNLNENITEVEVPVEEEEDDFAGFEYDPYYGQPDIELNAIKTKLDDIYKIVDLIQILDDTKPLAVYTIIDKQRDLVHMLTEIKNDLYKLLVNAED